MPNTRAALDNFVQKGGWADLYYAGLSITQVMIDVRAKLKAGQ